MARHRSGAVGVDDPLALLERDHRDVEQMIRDLAAADDAEDQGALVAGIRSALTRHMAIEEELLYPLVREVVGDDERTEAMVEHDLARSGMDQVEHLIGKPGLGAAVDALAAGIAHHVAEEEDDLFPRLRTAAADRLVEVAPAVRARHDDASGTGDLAALSKSDLLERARKAGISGRSSMTKDELAAALARS